MEKFTTDATKRLIAILQYEIQYKEKEAHKEIEFAAKKHKEVLHNFRNNIKL